MKFDVSFDELFKALEIMGGKPQRCSISLQHKNVDLQLNDQLQKEGGIEIALKDLKTQHHLLYWNDQMVILFIPSANSKFHVSRCQTLEGMSASNRFYKYNVTTNQSGVFEVFGQEKVRLNVCKNCLRLLNYEGYRYLNYDKRDELVHNFNIRSFFQAYQHKILDPRKARKAFPQRNI